MQLVPAFCLITILLLVNRAELPVRLKEQLARVLFQLKTWGMAEIFLAGVLVSFVKLMAYGSIGVGSSFPGVYFVSCNCALFSALIVAGYGTTSPRCQNCASR